MSNPATPVPGSPTHQTPFASNISDLANVLGQLAQGQQQLQAIIGNQLLTAQQNQIRPTKLPVPTDFVTGERPEDFVARVRHFLQFAPGYEDEGTRCCSFKQIVLYDLSHMFTVNLL
jgi:hypothetical protein